MKSSLFNSRMKLADLIVANNSLILMMSRLGIPLGFGDKSVQEVCNSYHLPSDFVLLVCNVYTFDDYLPDMKQIAATDMSPLVPYLRASHNYYLHDRLPHIAGHLNDIAARVGDRYGNILKQFLADYQKEIQDHFRCEESEVFPQLLALQQGEPLEAQVASRFVESHSNIEDKLSDLTQIVYKYLPSNAMPDEPIVELVLDILQVSSDLKKHALLEEKVLLPYMAWLKGERL